MSEAFENKPEDYLNKGLRAAIGSLPIVGGAAAEFFQFVVADPAQERRDDFLRATFDQVTDLRGKFDGLNREALRDNEQFQATVVQAVKIAAATASDQKKGLLQNAILNSAIGPIDEATRHIFMRMIDEYTPAHVAFLKFLAAPANYPLYVEAIQRGNEEPIHANSPPSIAPIFSVFPDLAENRALFFLISRDLGSSNCANTTFNSWDRAKMLEPKITDFGEAFLKFVTAPL